MHGDCGEYDSSGQTTIKIDSGSDHGFTGALEWRTETNTEELLVYSRRQEMDNIIKLLRLRFRKGS